MICGGSQTFIRLTPRFTAVVTKPEPQAVAAKGRRVEAKLGGGSLDHAGDVARSKSLIPHPLGPPIENPSKDSPFAHTGRLQPSLKRRHWTCDVTPWDANPAAEPS
jgi:hypothetical protein